MMTIKALKSFALWLLLSVAIAAQAVELDVRTFGAKLDGTTDDYAALNAAWQACPTAGCTININGTNTAQTLLIGTGVIVTKNNVTFRIAGGTTVKVKNSSNITPFTF